MKEMKYPNDKIKSMTSIILGDSSSDGINGDNNKKDPKEGNGVGNLVNSLFNGDAIDLVKIGTNAVKGITTTGISGKGTQLK